MSKLAKGIKKTFKKVGKAVKKIAVPLLATAAIVYTAGAAMGVSSMAGGWTAAASKGLASIGVNSGSVLGSTITGAITKAGTGAAVGGLVSSATGGSFSDGATTGALAGAVMGGVGGYMNPAGTTAATAAAPGVASAAAPAANAAPAVASSAAAPASVGNFMGGVGNFLKSETGGRVISGLASGGLQAMAAKSADDAAKDEQRRITGSYEGVGDALQMASGDATTPNYDRYRRRTEEKPQNRRRYQWDPTSGTIVSA